MTIAPGWSLSNPHPGIAMTHKARTELFTILRFIAVGIFNTAIGYAIILLGLSFGLGDFAANALGFALGIPLAHRLHRHFTFRAARVAGASELVRFALVFAAAYGVNVAVLAAGRQLAWLDGVIVQLIAICTYAAVFYVLNRLIVFRAGDTASVPRSSASPR